MDSPTPIYTPVPDLSQQAPAAQEPNAIGTPQKAAEGAEVHNGGPIKEWFEDINILDVSISAFIIASVFYVVNYYKYQMLLEKSTLADLRTKIDNMDNRIKQMQNMTQGRKLLL